MGNFKCTDCMTRQKELITEILSGKDTETQVTLKSLPEDFFETKEPRLEKTYIMIKPDGVQRGLIGEIIKRFEKKGFKLLALKFFTPSKKLLEEHYAEHKGKPFYEPLIKYMSMGPVVCMIWQGLNIVSTSRKMMGATKPENAEPNTIRGDFCVESGRNVIHGSDSVKSAEREIKLWFKPEEIQQYNRNEKWLYEK